MQHEEGGRSCFTGIQGGAYGLQHGRSVQRSVGWGVEDDHNPTKKDNSRVAIAHVIISFVTFATLGIPYNTCRL
jgi:hypothetical protein